MRSILVIGCVLVWSMDVSAQWRLYKEVSWKDADQLELDGKGAMYVTRTNGDLAKFTADGSLMLEYSPLVNNRVQQIDFNSQFKVYLFYQDFQETVILNRYLSAPVKYNYADFGFGFVSDIAPDSQQTIWLVDMSSFSLIRIDPGRNEVLERRSLAQVLNQGSATDVVIKNHDNRSYLIDSKQGVFVFDNLGNFLFELEVVADEIGFFRDELYYVNEGMLQFVNLYSQKKRALPLPKVASNKFRYFDGVLYLLEANGFKIYK
ncbi:MULTISPECIES: hypothetical protein [Reichenbachiella]|uniref:hypothetical protein n=1 Tax=Reichenbachiella TaxID=156993 RepID=UPI000E6BC08A|nr:MULTISPECIES: hypothetical protein [Reichenbachiella]MBU2915322.1 hypothetical protein [Reichenbachiella agariperforans]RJE70544.1 hypothetical protein BGP76_10680 [Reichenbachiella sp. MSK19-1]